MNRFTGEIKEIETQGDLSLVVILVGNLAFSSIVLETPESTPYLKIGGKIDVIFKETEVMLSVNRTGEISTRTRIAAVVKDIEHGKLLSRVRLQASIGEFTSLITTQSVQRLRLEQGSLVEALIKTNEILLMP